MHESILDFLMGVLGGFFVIALTLIISQDVTEHKGQAYEVCRDKLFTAYPQEVDYKEWRGCLNG